MKENKTDKDSNKTKKQIKTTKRWNDWLMARLLGFCQMTKTMQIFVPYFSFMAEQQIVIILIKTHF